jgi:hypothetical protein
VFGPTPDDRALSLDLVKGQETALARVSIMEDSVVEHGANGAVVNNRSFA